MLTAEERQEIDQALHAYPTRRAGCVEALKIIQRHRRWVSDEALADLAEMLGLSPADLDSVASFYNLIFREPVGRHVILLCDSVSCWINGYAALRDHFKQRFDLQLDQTTADQRFTLLPNVCLGACDRAPVMMVDDDLHGDLVPESIDTILKSYE